MMNIFMSLTEEPKLIVYKNDLSISGVKKISMRFILPRGFGGSDCSIFGSIFVILLFIALIY